jgi:hypothetical protein
MDGQSPGNLHLGFDQGCRGIPVTSDKPLIDSRALLGLTHSVSPQNDSLTIDII